MEVMKKDMQSISTAREDATDRVRWKQLTEDVFHYITEM